MWEIIRIFTGKSEPAFIENNGYKDYINGTMISVGVRDLKNQLSQYLQYVKHGERVFITEHNRIIAEISLPRDSTEDRNTEQLLDGLAKEGKVLRASRNMSVATSSENPIELNWIDVYRDNRDQR